MQMMLEHVVKFNFVDAGADPADAPLVCGRRIPNLTQLRLRVSACSMLGLLQLMLMLGLRYTNSPAHRAEPADAHDARVQFRRT